MKMNVTFLWRWKEWKQPDLIKPVELQLNLKTGKIVDQFVVIHATIQAEQGQQVKLGY